MATQGERIIVRCFAYPSSSEENDGFCAVCIDLNLVTWRSTLQEARTSLNTAIEGYFETVMETAESEEEALSLFHRPAPFWPYQFYYYMLSLLILFIKPFLETRATLFENQINNPLTSATA